MDAMCGDEVHEVLLALTARAWGGPAVQRLLELEVDSPAALCLYRLYMQQSGVAEAPVFGTSV